MVGLTKTRDSVRGTLHVYLEMGTLGGIPDTSSFTAEAGDFVSAARGAVWEGFCGAKRRGAVLEEEGIGSLRVEKRCGHSFIHEPRGVKAHLRHQGFPRSGRE